MTTTEQNKLIAEFEGHKINWGFDKKGVLMLGHHIREDKLNYHESWEWLMPVVEKIETDVYFKVDIDYRTCDIDPMAMAEMNFYHVKSFSVNASTKIEAVYQAVVQFIIWFNNNKD